MSVPRTPNSELKPRHSRKLDGASRDKALHDSEEKYRLLFETMTQGVVHQAADGTIISANPAAERILGLSSDQMRGMTSMDQHWQMIGEDGLLVPGSDHPSMIALRTGTTVGPVIRGVFHPARNTHTWLSITAIPLFQPDETKPFQVYAIFEDITGRKKAEDALLESEQRFQKVLGVIPDMVSIHSPDLDILYSNWQGFAAVSKAKQISNTKCYKTYRDLHAICPDCRAKTVLETREPLYEEAMLPDGRWLDLRVIPLLDEDNNVEMFVEWVSDITKRKHAEEYLLKFKQIVSSTADAISLLDTDYRYVIVNKAYEAFSGKKQEELVGITVEEYLGETVFRELVKPHLDDCLKGETIRYQDWFSYPTLGRRFVEVTYFPYIDASGKITGVVANTRDITEQKRIEQSLRESEALLREKTGLLQNITNHMFDMVAITDLAGVFTYAGPSHRILGYEPEQLVGTSVFDYVHPEDSAYIADEFHQFMIHPTPDTTPTVEFRQRCMDGSYLWLETKGKILFSDSGSPCALFFSSRDITERKKAEVALRNSESLFRKVFKILPVGLWIADKNGTLVEGNPTGVAIWGAEPTVSRDKYGVFRARRLPSGKEIAPDDWALAHTVNKGETIVDELLEIDAFDGSKKIILNYTAPVLDDQGKIHAAIVVNQDITASYHANKALEHERSRLLLLLENLPGFIYLQASDYSVRYANSVFIDLFGEPKDRPCYQILHGRNEPCVNCPTFEVFRTHMPQVWEWSQAPDGKTYLVYDFPFIDSDETFLVLEYGVDITERKQAEVERATLQEQLHQAQKMESIGLLAGGVAHDFNNMLGVILGHTEFALEAVSPSEPLYTDLEEIQKAARRSADLTRQLLAFARRQTIAPEVLVLNDTIENMLTMLRRLIGEDIDLLWKPGHDLWPVKVDLAQIHQILANLCVNARDAIADVGKVTIETCNVILEEDYCREHAGFIPGEYSMLAVSDNGCGMEAATLNLVFEPFFTTKELGKGTGLGLATVYGVVKQNNGFINVYSEPGLGTTFKIYLPHHVVQWEETKEPRLQAVERGNETILLVEDEPAILKMTTKMLERLGYSVLAAPTPGRAIRLAREHAGRIDLVMTDMIMPEMNGRDLVKNLLSIKPELRHLFMSGYTENVIAQHGILDEGVNFIQKPFSLENLSIKVREVLG